MHASDGWPKKENRRRPLSGMRGGFDVMLRYCVLRNFDRRSSFRRSTVLPCDRTRPCQRPARNGWCNRPDWRRATRPVHRLRWRGRTSTSRTWNDRIRRPIPDRRRRSDSIRRNRETTYRRAPSRSRSHDGGSLATPRRQLPDRRVISDPPLCFVDRCRRMPRILPFRNTAGGKRRIAQVRGPDQNMK